MSTNKPDQSTSVLSRILDLASLQALLDIVYSVSGIAAVLFDADSAVVATTARPTICHECFRSDPFCHCEALRAGHGELLASADSHCFSVCPHGLTDCVLPLYVAEQRVGTLLVGQVFTQQPNLDAYRSEAKANNLDERAYLQHVARIPVVTEEYFTRLLPLIADLVRIFVELGTVRVQSGQTERQLQAALNTTETALQQLQQHEDSLQRTNRSLRLLSSSNQMLLRATDEGQLLEDVCSIAVNVSGYSFSWIGFKGADAEQSVIPAAFVGREEGFLTAAQRMSWGDNAYGQSAISTAIRTGTTQLRLDILNDCRLAPWHEDARKRDYQSAIAVPLYADTEIIGALAIYAAESFAFGEAEVRLLEDLARDVSFGIATIRLRKAHEQAGKRIERLAFFDGLTGLPNRNAIADLLKNACRDAVEKGYQFSVVMLDLGHIHEINETYGHETGDAVLVEIARRLVDTVAMRGTVTRFGGDDFAIISSPLSQLELIDLAEKLLAAVCQPLTIDDHLFSLRGNIGIALYPADAESPNDLLARAELAMSKAQACGGGYRFYSHEMTQELFRKLSLMHRLESALAENNLQLWYQPKVDLSDGTMLGAEALLRWNDPVLGFVNPAEFIGLAEERGLMPAIGEWIFTSVCDQMVRWKEQKTQCAGKIAINVSAKQFDDLYFLERVERVFLQSGISPECVELELTESCLMRDPERIIEILSSLRWLGFSLAIDDFGTGYSSLSYLKRFPITTLKIDRSFVTHLTNDSNDRAIVSTIMAIAAQLELDTVAEGVETEEQRLLLLELGCRLAQGYYFSKPVPAAALLDYRFDCGKSVS